MARILLVDDEPGLLFALKELLGESHDPVTASSGQDALRQLEGIDAAIVDLSMPHMDGIELIQRIHERDPALPVMLLTAHGSERVAVRAMKAGAFDYLTKPFDNDELLVVVDRALETRALRVENRRLSAEHAIGRKIIGSSPAMQRMLEAVARIADKDVTVLLRGETGTGKELVASLIHAESKRKKKALVRFNCAAIPAELAEAELFGYSKGAFTGAQSAHRGFFAEADGTTLVLDEIGEVPLPLQAKLLRALQEGEIQPLGSGRVEKVDVRIVASTNRDLEAEVRAGRFREDLYYRLAVVELIVPPLRSRREDIPPLAAELARSYAQKFGVGELRFSPDVLNELVRADWPGNVRQLENFIARLTVLYGGQEIGKEVLLDAPNLSGQTAPEVEEGLTLKEQVEAYERGIIVRALEAASGNQSEAARRLGVNRVTLIDKLRKYKLGG